MVKPLTSQTTSSCSTTVLRLFCKPCSSAVTHDLPEQQPTQSWEEENSNERGATPPQHVFLPHALTALIHGYLRSVVLTYTAHH
eukprot:2450-Eustigmatos_ZCMA.PRE.1